MSTPCEEIQALMSGYLDRELSDADRRRVEDHVIDCGDCARELESMRALVSAAEDLEMEPLPDEVWDDFAASVTVRLERQLGFTLLGAGGIVLLLASLVAAITVPWAPPVVRAATGAAILGLGVLFVSVFRQRRFALRTDKYSRDVRR